MPSARWRAETSGAGGDPGAAATAEFAARWGFDAESRRLRAALTHRSATRSLEKSSERLEFLGDAVLGFVVAEFLIHALPRAPEGALSRARTQVVRKETLAEAARALGIESLLLVGAGEEKLGDRTRDSLLADAYEAVIGALFLDKGGAAAARFVHDTLRGPLSTVAAAPPEPDPKTRLQILLQGQGRGLPAYRIVSESGQGHNMHFIAEALVDGQPLGQGEGATKRAATANAAAAALQALEKG